jgi:hypothetical protein
MRLQLHCDNCGALVFPGQRGACKYCGAPVGYPVKNSEKRSALPTERLTQKPVKDRGCLCMFLFFAMFVEVFVFLFAGLASGPNWGVTAVSGGVLVSSFIWFVWANQKTGASDWQDVVNENERRLKAEARVLLHPENQDRNVQDQIMQALVEKYFPTVYLNQGSDGRYGTRQWWAYNLGWQRAGENSPWEPVIQLSYQQQNWDIWAHRWYS